MKSFFLAAALAAATACVPVPMTTTGGIPTGASLSQTAPAFVSFDSRINAFRAQNGESALASNARLDGAAAAYAAQVRASGTLSHRLGGTRVSDRVASAGIATCSVGENLANGHATADAAFEAWLKSPQHRANMVGRQFTHYGLGQSGVSWILVLARPC